MALDHTAISARIREIIEANTTPAFVQVFEGLISGLPLGGPYAVYRYAGREELGQTLRGQIQVDERWVIHTFWLYGPERTTLAAADIELADADQALRTAFRADATLSGLVSPTLRITNSEIPDGPSGFLFGGDAMYMALKFELLLPDREAEATIP